MKGKKFHLITIKCRIKCHLHIAFSLLLLSFVSCSDSEFQVLKETSNEDMNVDLSNDDILVTTEINDQSSVTEREQTNGSSNDSKKLDKLFLLPLSIKPLHYKLEVIPLLFDVDTHIFNSFYHNASRFTAPGKVWIQFVCLTETTNVTLHAFKDLKIETRKITVTNLQTEKIIVINNVTRDNDTDFLVLYLAHSIGQESGGEIFSLFIEFTARIADDRLNGLYLDYYIHPETKEKRYLSTTLFAPNHARKAFPCFDEPGLKANFSISIGRKDGSGYSSISNMPLVRTKPIPDLRGWVLDEFDVTIPLPTYLVAMITTDFKFRKIKDGNLELRLHAPEHLIKRTKTIDVHSLNETSYSKSPNPYLLQDPLRFIAASLKMWQGTKLGLFPLPKLDVIALPHFYFNAMENFGAITFKYPVILNVENVTTTSELLRLSFVAGHEVAHQWFGNILTPKSWTYVWLKESFSDLFSRLYLSEKVNVGYKHEDFVNNELQRAMRFDGGPDTHAMENHVKTAFAVGEIYTDIPYRKGASIMNMVRIVLSDSIFKEGLESLFVEKKYSNIDQNDLFSHLQSTQQKYHVLKSQGLNGNTTLTDILNTWTQQCGYPVVHIKRKGPILILKQEKFQNMLVQTLKLIENETKIQEENSVFIDEIEKTVINATTTEVERWWIPISIFKHEDTYNKRVYSTKWLPPNDDQTVINLGQFHSITNVEGYFRILYGKEELHSILKGLIRDSFSGKLGVYVNSNYIDFPPMQPVERSQFLDDYFTFAFSKYEEVPISLLFHIVSLTLPHEYEYVVWRTFFQNMWKPYQLFQNTEYFSSLQKYLIHLLRPLNTFMESQKQTILSAPCFHSSAVIRKMYFSQFSSLVFSWICAIDSESCGDLAMKHVHNFIETGDISTIPADFQESMYCAAVKYAKEEDLPYLWSSFEKLYFQEFYPVQKDRYLKALSCARNITYLEILLTWTTNATHDFHDIDRVTLLKNVIANSEGRGLILDFLDRNFDVLYKSDSVANPVTEALRAFVEYVNVPDQLEEMETFISSHADTMEKKKKFLEKQVKKAKLNILWMETFAENIRESVDYHSQNTFGNNNREECLHESLSDFEDYVSQITDWE